MINKIESAKKNGRGTATFNFTCNDATFDVVVTELFDQNQANVSYTVVGKKITLK